MEFLADPQIWIALATLTLLELVLGIDNIIFISILSGKLPAEQQPKARYIGLGGALVMRVILLFSLSWIIGLTEPLFTVFGQGVSGRDLVLLVGGLFLIAKSTHEIHGSLEGEEGHAAKKVYASFVSVIVQIMLLDIVFSLDSVITAIGMVEQLWVMITAVVISIVAMMFFAAPIGAFCPTASDGEDARAFVFASDRFYARRRRISSAYSERLHLRRDGVFGSRRNFEYPYAQENRAGSSA
jgi:predicted tellurium resistance membrane protein TerC